MGDKGIIFKTYTGGTVSIPENLNCNKESNRLVCYPNPASETISISFQNENQNIQSIAIYNSTGISIKSVNKPIGNGITAIDISELQAGIYLAVAISSENEIIATGKFVVK